ncbi:shikimate kinase [Treponema sp. OMZ 305]|uniref:shikimate kinase n=1 Tax=Treponema sp. OMZ 305 TaxID=1659192 RepID=UPI0020A4DA32|nr:shikimate kinase [Treponema sp. OMZ 305]UTC57620.1 shikimate kinase [Treponema sp. OMZ 305]
MILLGLSHAGKTSVGRLLAEQLRLPFYDTDERICIRTGLTPRELCRQAGLSALHAAEAASLRECCSLHACCGDAPAAELWQYSTPLPLRIVGSVENGQDTAAENGAVIAAGGGICDNTEASAIIAAIPLRVFLYATEAVLFERLTRDAVQTGYYPAFLRFLPAAQKAEAQQLFTELYVRRTELYRKSSTLIIDTSGLDCAAVAQRIAASLFCGCG